MDETLIRLRQALCAPSLDLHFERAWGSAQEDHRKMIREALADRLKAPAFLRSDHLPTSETHSVSISHCHNLGGFAFINRPSSVGVDVELTERVHSRLIERIATADEIREAPDLASIWTGKEATWKSLLQLQQPPTISHISLRAWQRISSGLSTFEAGLLHDSRTLTGLGAVWDEAEVKFSVFIFSPSTYVQPCR